MAEFSLSVAWHLKRGEEFEPGQYSQDHDWTFTGGEVVPASGAANLGGSPDRANPEEALIAATSSCHMLTFLAIAAKSNLKMVSYLDQPTGVVGKLEGGRKAVTEITLRPRVVFSEGDMSEEDLMKLHESAHKYCFISNSLTTEVKIEPQHEFRT
jgi:organic hydroperoxide reductase OsmC/OhrA